MSKEGMNIIFVGTCCSRKAYRAILAEEQRVSQQYQKYCTLLLQGVRQNGVAARSLAVLPVNTRNNRKKYISLPDDEENGIYFTYVPCLNVPVLKRIVNFGGIVVKLWRLISQNPDCVIIADPFSVSAYTAARIVSRRRGKKIVGIVTDLPTAYGKRYDRRPTITQTLSRMLDETCDGYMCITDELNSVVNKGKKPCVIIEGFADSRIDPNESNKDAKAPVFTVLYAGGLYKQYGIEDLVKGFMLADLERAELHLYGDGAYVPEIEMISQVYDKITYYGVKDNDHILQEEKKAWVLINPRPTLGFTKYSFPSKNMEYMASGTYTATTDLPGMPKEYKKYVFIIEDATAEGIATALKALYALPCDELTRRGEAAKEWILKNRNNTVQMRKVLDMIETL